MAGGVGFGCCGPWSAVWRASVCLWLVLLIQPSLAQTRPAVPVTPSSGAPVADGVEVVSSGDVTRLVFDLTAPVAAQAYLLADPDRVITLQNFGQTPGVNCTVRTTNSRLNISPSHFDYIINQSPVSVTVTGLNSTSTIYHDTLSVTCSNSTTIFSSGTFTIPFIH